jgi:hypothetical protein
MTSVAEGAAAPSEFQRRGAFFRNVVIASSLSAAAVLAVSAYLMAIQPRLDTTGHAKSASLGCLAYNFFPLGFLAFLQVVPLRKWRLAGLVAFVLAGYTALLALILFWFCLSVYSYLGIHYVLCLLPSELGFAAAFISLLYLGRYCRGWAREFAAAKAAEATGRGIVDSQQKETP